MSGHSVASDGVKFTREYYSFLVDLGVLNVMQMLSCCEDTIIQENIFKPRLRTGTKIMTAMCFFLLQSAEELEGRAYFVGPVGSTLEPSGSEASGSPPPLNYFSAFGVLLSQNLP